MLITNQQKVLVNLLLLLLISALAQNARADIIPVNPLDFGTIAITSRSLPASISIRHETTIPPAYLGSIYPISETSRGEFSLTKLPSYAIVNITHNILDSQSHSSAISGGKFILTDLNHPNQITTDANGNASFFVGGRIETTGNNLFSNSTHTINYQIVINY